MDHGLTPYHGNVQSLALAGGPSHAARHLANASSSDLLIAIAFRVMSKPPSSWPVPHQAGAPGCWR